MIPGDMVYVTKWDVCGFVRSVETDGVVVVSCVAPVSSYDEVHLYSYFPGNYVFKKDELRLVDTKEFKFKD